MKKIFVTGVGGPAGLAVLRNLLEKSDKTWKIYGGDMDPNASGFTFLNAPERILLPKATQDDFLEWVLALHRKHQFDVIIPTVDEELIPLGNRRSQLPVLISPQETLRKVLNKQILFVVSAGKRYSPQAIPMDLHESRLPETLFIKPAVGSGSQGIKCLSRAEFIEWKSTIGPKDHYLAQEYLPGKEYTVDTLCDPSGNLQHFLIRHRVSTDSGISTVGEVVFNRDIEEFVHSLTSKFQFQGGINIQFKEDENGVPKLLEINPRFAGGLPLTLACGFDHPFWAVQAYLGQETPQVFEPPKPLRMIRFLESHFMPVEAHA